MTVTVKIGEAKTHLSELLAKVEAGEDVIIARGNDPIAKLSRLHEETSVEAALADILSARAGRQRTSSAELRAWRDEGRRS